MKNNKKSVHRMQNQSNTAHIQCPAKAHNYIAAKVKFHVAALAVSKSEHSGDEGAVEPVGPGMHAQEFTTPHGSLLGQFFTQCGDIESAVLIGEDTSGTRNLVSL